MRAVRSILFVFLFNAGTFVQMVFWLPVAFILPRKLFWNIPKSWGWSMLWMQHLLIGTRFEFRGVENVPQDRGYIMAAKHQSSWETYATLLFLNNPSYILKRELMFIPFFGWLATKGDVIPVNRGKQREALKAMNKEAKRQIGDNRQIVIYPEGTRKTAFAEPAYKYGITHMYQDIEVPVLPAALNSGIFWPRNSLLLYRGTCVLEFLPVIEPGLDAETFSEELVETIEKATAKLLDEGVSDPEYDGPGRDYYVQ